MWFPSKKHLELHLGCRTCWLSYFTLVCRWCGRTVACLVYGHVITKFSRKGRLPFAPRVELRYYYYYHHHHHHHHHHTIITTIIVPVTVAATVMEKRKKRTFHQGKGRWFPVLLHWKGLEHRNFLGKRDSRLTGRNGLLLKLAFLKLWSLFSVARMSYQPIKI